MRGEHPVLRLEGADSLSVIDYSDDVLTRRVQHEKVLDDFFLRDALVQESDDGARRRECLVAPYGHRACEVARNRDGELADGQPRIASDLDRLHAL
jgi:hypothetical protein